MSSYFKMEDENYYFALDNDFLISDESDNDLHCLFNEELSQTLSTNIKWTRQLTTELILLLKHQRVLWDPNVTRDTQTSQKALRFMAVHLSKLHPNIAVNDIKTKIHTIRTQYRKELRRMRKMELRGKNAKPQLWCFALLDFLWPICTNGEEMPSIKNTDLPPEVTLALNMREMYDEAEDDININNVSPRDHSIKWNREKTKILIMLYKANRILWDSKYKDNYKSRNDALQEIAFEMTKYYPLITTYDIKAKIHTIRSQYGKELRAVNQSKLKTSINRTERKPKLWCFDMLSFLLPTFTENPKGKTKSEHSGKAESYEDITPLDIDICYDEFENNWECLDDESVPAPPELKRHENKTEKYKATEPRFYWLGNQVVSTLNEIQDEDLIYDTVMALKKLLKFAKEKENNILNDPLSTQLEVLDGFEAEVRSLKTNTMLESNKLKTFDLKFDVNLLQLENISVKVVNQTIVVQGDHSNKSENLATKFFRRYDIPKGFDINTVQAILSDDNILTVQVSKTTLANLVAERNIPIYRINSI